MRTWLSKTVLALFIITFPFLYPTQALAQTAEWTGVCVDGGNPNNPNYVEDVATLQGLECLIGNIFAVIITIIGLAGFVMFIYGSFRWLLSGGSAKDTDAARNTMTFAIVGIVVALCGFIFLNLIASFTGVGSVLNIFVPRSNDGLP